MTLLADRDQTKESKARLEDLFLTAGSIVGREHVRTHRNNQDAVAMSRRDDLIVAAVADGCSSSRYSEVGARLAVNWVAQRVPTLARIYRRDPDRLADRLQEQLLRYLDGVVRPLCAEPSDRPRMIGDLLLFTLLIIIVEPDTTSVLTAGDGLICVNEEPEIVLTSGPDNAPAYPAYRLLQQSAMSPLPMRKIALERQIERPTESIQSLLVATDGATELMGDPYLTEIQRDPRFLRNLLTLQRQLVVLGHNQRRLRDDTTVLLLRRRGPSCM